jgi:hypothetical protein
MSGSTEKEGTKRNLTVKKPAKVTKRDAAAQPAKRPLGKERSGGKAKPEKLVCRYCGSDDLSPSFIKRRDRRCRKCLSKRYGSAVGGKKTSKKK